MGEKLDSTLMVNRYIGIRYCDIVVSYIMGNFIGAMIECHGSYEDSLNFWFLKYIAKLMG